MKLFLYCFSSVSPKVAMIPSKERMEVLEDEMLELECIATGKPAPVITWTRMVVFKVDQCFQMRKPADISWSGFQLWLVWQDVDHYYAKTSHYGSATNKTVVPTADPVQWPNRLSLQRRLKTLVSAVPSLNSSSTIAQIVIIFTTTTITF